MMWLALWIACGNQKNYQEGMNPDDCGDQIDNDEDGSIDCNDSSCSSSLECSKVIDAEPAPEPSGSDPLESDSDHDGFNENQGDCDDSDPDIHPNAPETPEDNIDSNCDNEDNPDNDGDGYFWGDDCDDSDTQMLSQTLDQDCDGLLTADDCDDTDANIPLQDQDCDGFLAPKDCDDSNPNLLGFEEDNDCDGFTKDLDCNESDPNMPNNDRDCDGVPTIGDCNDTNDTMPTFDADCDGLLTEDDCDDNDPSSGTSVNDADCDGIPTNEDCDDLNVNKPINDRDCDGVFTVIDCDDDLPSLGAIQQDSDCDGATNDVDCAPQDATNSLSDDCDQDGSLRINDCDDQNPNRFPNNVEIFNNGIDENCDLLEDCYEDSDGDGFGIDLVIQSSSLNCASGGGANNTMDCDDSNPLISPDASEIFYNDVDEDCNPDNEWDADGDGVDSVTVNENGLEIQLDCDDTDPENILTDDCDQDGYGKMDDCDDHDIHLNPDIDEVCDNIDNNCNTEVDEGFQLEWFWDGDGDGFGSNDSTMTGCSPSEGFVATNTDCDDNNIEIYPGNNKEIGVFCIFDEDGDGFGSPNPPEGFDQGTDCDDTLSTVFPGSNILEVGLCVYDSDGDGFGDAEATEPYDAGLDCDDNNIEIYPTAREICDGIDNNCDDAIDEVSPANTVPIAVTPYISLDPTGYFGSNIILDETQTAFPFASDAENSTVDVFVNWMVDDQSLTRLFVPFSSEVCDLKDISGNENNPTIVGNLLRIDGIDGEGLEFLGSGSYIDLQAENILSETFTFSAWIYQTDTSATHRVIFSQGHSDQFISVLDGKLSVTIGSLQFQHPDPIPLDSWSYVNVVHKGELGNDTILYVNGIDYVVPDPFPHLESGANFIGQEGSYDASLRFFTGKIDDLIVYDRPLNTEQIQSIYNSGIPNYRNILASETNLGEEWKLEFIPYDGELFGTKTISEGMLLSCHPDEICE